MCQGYYNHADHVARVAGHGAAPGLIVHPQSWPQDLDWTGKRVVVIGSGATAATRRPGDGGDRRARHDAAAHADVHHRRAEDARAGVQLRALDIPEEWTHEILRRAYIEQFTS